MGIYVQTLLESLMTPLELALYLEQTKKKEQVFVELQLELDPMPEMEYIPNKETDHG